MKGKTCVLIPAAFLICAVLVPAQWLAGQAAGGDDNPDARPPVTKADVRIVQRAREIQLPIGVEPRRYAGLPGGCKDLQPVLCVGKGH